MRTIAVVGVPSSAGAHAPGQERAPEALRRAGIVEALSRSGFRVVDRGDLPKVRWTPDRDHARAQHAEQVAEVASQVADEVAAADADAVLVLGGDCTIEVGVVSGFARGPESIGLLYLDAGADLNVPDSIREGFLDWMGGAHLLGLAGATHDLSHLGPRFPLLRPDDIVFVGAEPQEMTDWENEVIREKGLRVLWAEQIRGRAAQAAAEALAALEDRVDRILVHFDLDVVDHLDFPAGDFATINAGLTLAEALECVEVFARHPKFAALTVAEFNPDHVDEEHEQVRRFVNDLVEALSPQAG
jgi:arginase